MGVAQHSLDDVGQSRGAGALRNLQESIAREVTGIRAKPREVLARVQQMVWAAAAQGAFEPWTSAGPGAPPKSTMIKGGGRLRKWKLQLFRIADGTSHPPHCHDNLASCLVVLQGRVHAREFDRVRAGENSAATTLVPVFDAELQPGEGLITTEDYRNCHWFGSVGGPALAVNFKASGYMRFELFRFKVRRYVDARAARQPGGRASFLVPEVARQQYGGNILQE